ncbi:MAG: MlaD family protein [Mangrovibacterium sp.]
MGKSKYIKLGALIACCIIMFVWGINYLKGIDILKTSNTYYVKYNRVDGLVKSSVILVNGFQIGLVQDIYFSDANDGSFIVELTVQGDIKIPKGSTAVLGSSDLLGTKAIKISFLADNEYYAEGDTLPSSIDDDMLELLGNEVMPLKDKALQLLMSVDSTMYALNSVLSLETQENLRQSILHFNYTMQNMSQITAQLNGILKNRGENLDHVISNIDTLSAAFSSSSESLKNTLSNLSNLSDSLSKSNIKAAIDDMATIMSSIENSEGSLGLLINDKNLYENLDSSAKSLNELLSDLQQNPSKYLKLTAIDLGKDIYISAPDVNENYTFCILLMQSSTPIELNNSMFNGLNVREKISDDNYYYLTPQENNFLSISEQLNSIKEVFPNAQILAFKNDKEVKLNKAIKELSKQ